jgi:hypothetical protein
MSLNRRDLLLTGTGAAATLAVPGVHGCSERA